MGNSENVPFGVLYQCSICTWFMELHENKKNDRLTIKNHLVQNQLIDLEIINNKCDSGSTFLTIFNCVEITVENWRKISS